MRYLDLIRFCERDYLCHTGIEELVIAGVSAAGEALGVGGAAAEAATASTLLAAPSVAGTALSTTALTATEVAAAAPAAVAASSAPAWASGLSAVGTAASVGGTLLTAKSQADNSAYQQAVARSEAAALQQKANQETAAATRAEITRDRQTQLVQSRARALSAASGTLATDPGEVKIEGDIAQQGQYNALSALYEGMASASSDRYQANIDLFKARRVGDALPYQIGGTVLQGVSSFADNRLRRNYLLNQYGGF